MAKRKKQAQNAPRSARVGKRDPNRSAPSMTDVEILEAAHISDDLQLGSNPPPGLIARLFQARSEGLQVVRVYWKTGQVAWMPCPPGAKLPDPEMIITAYRNLQSISKNYPEGDVLCL